MERGLVYPRFRRVVPTHLHRGLHAVARYAGLDDELAFVQGAARFAGLNDELAFVQGAARYAGSDDELAFVQGGLLRGRMRVLEWAGVI